MDRRRPATGRMAAPGASPTVARLAVRALPYHAAGGGAPAHGPAPAAGRGARVRSGVRWIGARSSLPLVLAALLVTPGLAQESGDGFPRRPSLPSEDEAPPPDPLEEGDLDFEELEKWIVLREEAAPPPPLVRAQLGPVFWIDVQSEIRADRAGVRGTRLDDLEGAQGLRSSGVSPWIELSIGRDVRGGADVLYLERGGEPTRQDGDVFFDGVHLAAPGDVVDTRFQLLTTSGYVEWDPLYGKTYRFGLLGGVRYFRLQAKFRGVRSQLSPAVVTLRRRAELLSPLFGGFVELTPFEMLTVSARVQFMNWSWSDVGLRDARYLEFRLGGVVQLIPGVLGVGADFRYLVVRAEGDNDDDRRRMEGGMAASGVALTLTLAF